MTNNKKITSDLLGNIAHEVLSVNHNVLRWPNYLGGNRYNELAKQSLNMIATFILVKRAEEKGIEIDETRIPYIALKRLIEKTVNGDIRDDHLAEILALRKISRQKFDENIDNQILGKMSELSQKLLNIKEEWIETKIYKIATKIATLVELKELDPNDVNSEKNILNMILSYGKECPWLMLINISYDSNEFQFLQEVSKLRGAIRWLKQFRATDCSVLEHLGEVAIFSWLMSMAEEDHDETMSTKAFWLGLFHDVAERWTGDMASPIKDSIKDLRQAVEDFEKIKMQEHVYSLLNECEGRSIKELIKAQDEEEYHNIFKSADYASAAMECYRNIMCGSRDKYFREVLTKDYRSDGKIKYKPLFLNLIDSLVRML